MTAGTGRPLWRLGNRNWRNLYRGDEHVGMLIDPEVAAVIARTMNGEHDRDERLRAEGAADAARDIVAGLRDAYDDSPALLRAVDFIQAYAAKPAETAVGLPAGSGR